MSATTHLQPDELLVLGGITKPPVLVAPILNALGIRYAPKRTLPTTRRSTTAYITSDRTIYFKPDQPREHLTAQMGEELAHAVLQHGRDDSNSQFGRPRLSSWTTYGAQNQHEERDAKFFMRQLLIPYPWLRTDIIDRGYVWFSGLLERYGVPAYVLADRLKETGLRDCVCLDISRYERVLRSPEWRAFTRAEISRRPICEQCHIKASSVLHHLFYARLGHELPSDVLALCRDCHDRKHGQTPIPSEQLSIWHAQTA